MLGESMEQANGCALDGVDDGKLEGMRDYGNASAPAGRLQR
jgi:hypothetical protein